MDNNSNSNSNFKNITFLLFSGVLVFTVYYTY